MKFKTGLPVLVLTLVAGITLLSGCGSDSDSGSSGGGSDEAGITIAAPWARTSPMEATTGAVYASFDNTGDTGDAIVSASVDSSVAKEVQIHETVMGANDSMEMKEVSKIELPAGKVTKLKPGGYHIMLMELTKPLDVGTKIAVTVKFQDAPSQTVKAEVRR
jgi:periplasmic copper chaperone A